MKLAHRGVYVRTQMKRTYCTGKVVVKYPARRHNSKRDQSNGRGCELLYSKKADGQAGGQAVRDVC